MGFLTNNNSNPSFYNFMLLSSAYKIITVPEVVAHIDSPVEVILDEL